MGDSWTLVEIRFWLVPEPSNPYDPNAVTVATGPDLSKALQVGYIGRKEAAQMSRRLTKPVDVMGIIIGKGNRWGIKLDRLTINGYLQAREAPHPPPPAEYV